MAVVSDSAGLVCDSCSAPAFVVEEKKPTVLAYILVVILTLGMVFGILLSFLGVVSAVVPIVALVLGILVAVTGKKTTHFVKCTQCSARRRVR